MVYYCVTWRNRYLIVYELDGEVLEVREREQVCRRLHGVAHHAQLEHERHLVLHVPPHLALRPRRHRRLAAKDHITVKILGRKLPIQVESNEP